MVVSYEEALSKSLDYFTGDDLAANVFVNKYALCNEKGELLEETPDDMHRRLAKEFARIEAIYPNPMSYEEVYGLLKGFERIVPQGSPMSAMGNPYKLQSLSNCFVIDSPKDSYAGILHTDQQQAQIMKRRGGVGFDLSNIRPKGLNTQNAAGTTDGIGIFMERFSNTCREVAQGGRRGALMLSISCHHPEIMTFINIKRDLKKITGANISVRWSNEFMKAIEEGGKAELRFPVEKDAEHLVKMEVDAKSIWDAFIDSAHNMADPGCLFWGTALERTPSDCYADVGYRSLSTNPCLSGDTKIAVADGRNAVSIKQLAEEGKDVPVYACDDSGRVVVKMMRNPRITGYEQDVYSVKLDDGSVFKATGNHKILTSSGHYVEVKDLVVGESLNVMTKAEKSIKDLWPTANSNSQDYLWIYTQGKKTPKSEHRMIWEFYNNERVPYDHVIHHVDFDAQNNSLSNLACMSRIDHNRLHSDHMKGANNPIFKIKSDLEKYKAYTEKMSQSTSGEKNGRYSGHTIDDIKEHAILLTTAYGRRFSNKEWIAYAAKHGLPQAFSRFRRHDFANPVSLSVWAAKQCNVDFCDEDTRLVRTLQSAFEQGYVANICPTNSGKEVFVERSCEECGKAFTVSYFKREISFCGSTCSNIYLNRNTDVNFRRTDTINSTYAAKAEELKRKQLLTYTALKASLGRKPMLKEWEAECKALGTPFRLKTKHGFKSWTDLSEQGEFFNHRVVSVEYAGKEDVYNGTVDDVHNFYFGGFESADQKTGKRHWTSINSRQCGEIILSPGDSCRLLCLNTLSYVRDPFLPTAHFDFEAFKIDTVKAQRLMDDLIDLEIEAVDRIIAKVTADPEPDDVKKIELDLWHKIREAAVNGRRTGLGVTAIGDAVAACGLRYGAPDSIALVEEIYKTLALGAYESSVVLAKERGAFPVWDLKKEEGHPFLDQIWAANPEFAKLHALYGRRNIALTTTAPTGSVSTMTQTTSGIEPVFMTHYTRRKKINPQDTSARVDFVDDLGDKWQEFTVYHHGVKRWMAATGKTDIAESPYHLATANEINWEAAVDLQAAAQKWICHAISKTTNLPATATKEDVHSVYWRGWKTGCKGITVYRDGCRSGVLISTDTSASSTAPATSADGRPTAIQDIQAPKRPKELVCDIHQASVKGNRWTIIVGLLDGRPYEIFAGHSAQLLLPAKYKSGRIVRVKQGHYDLHVDIGDEEELVVKDVVKVFDNAESAWATRMVSISLRHGVPIEFVCEQLAKDGGINDVNKVLARALKKYIPDGKKVAASSKCGACGSSNLVYEEGCLRCLDCGIGKC